MTALRHLVVVLGDQLDPDSLALADLDPALDAVWMCEAAYEARHAWSTKARIAVFLAGMRLFRDALSARGINVHYRALDQHQAPTLEAALAEDLRRLKPARVLAVRPGEWRLAEALPRVCAEAGVPWSERADQHFLCDQADFEAWAKGRKEYRLEHFQRWLRRRERVLMDGDEPAGGAWNFDAENRKRLPKGTRIPTPPRFAPDAITDEVLALVADRFGGNFGRLDGFSFPVTPEDAEAGLAAFLRERLPQFGDYQDAMAEGEPTLFHSLISTSLNIGLLDPLAVCRAAEAEWRKGRAPLNAVEGFIRQIIGWREYVRGLYWLKMPGYAALNALGADRALPEFYWRGDSGMACMDAAIGQTRDHAYAHHIQRLMVTGNFALLAGIDPAAINEWYLAVYADAFEWVELPNTHGMAIHADGGIMASKPYAASGKYIDRMSDHCGTCRHSVAEATGPRACPFNALYWDFMARHRSRFEKNPRMAQMYRTMDRMSPDKVAAMRRQAGEFLDRVAPRLKEKAA
jgi:deoxyribodipyrimidine photolyase-related protein